MSPVLINPVPQQQQQQQQHHHHHHQQQQQQQQHHHHHQPQQQQRRPKLAVSDTSGVSPVLTLCHSSATTASTEDPNQQSAKKVCTAVFSQSLSSMPPQHQPQQHHQHHQHRHRHRHRQQQQLTSTSVIFLGSCMGSAEKRFLRVLSSANCRSSSVTWLPHGMYQRK